MIYIKDPILEDDNSWTVLADFRSQNGEGTLLTQANLVDGGTIVLTEVYQITFEDKFGTTIKVVSASTCIND